MTAHRCPRYRRKSEYVFARQVRVADRSWPEEVHAWALPPADGSFGFVGTGAGLVHVWDGDWLLFDELQPVRVMRRQQFADWYEFDPEDAFAIPAGLPIA